MTIFSVAEDSKALTVRTQNSLLDLLLQDIPRASDFEMERVFLPQGALTLSGDVYFPEDALLTLAQVSANRPAVDVAVVGRYACVGPADLWGAQMQIWVMVPGYGCRLDWADIRAHAPQYSAWLWHTTAATHGLVQQMAQTAFCVQHHHATQRLASWLLMCLAQYGGDDLVLPLACLPASILASAADLQNTLQTLENQGALAWRDAHIEQLHAERLVALACRCHTMVKHTADAPPLQPL
ncbi:MAG: hypothetical protein RLZZ464_1757 [Pseudomonadota bacterium]|jgi:hypothetical protein